MPHLHCISSFHCYAVNVGVCVVCLQEICVVSKETANIEVNFTHAKVGRYFQTLSG